MRLFHYVFYFLFMYTYTISTEYVYPIASLNDGTIILYIHQTAQQSIELYEWNTHTQKTEPILWSVFNPGGLQLLPNEQAFSFIDNGRLRIKHFNKRAPKSIDFDEPIFNIQNIHWIDEHTCYCTAYYKDHCSIFELHDDGSLQFLRQKDDRDCMYPQKIDHHLFYIERSQTDYRIMQTKYTYDLDVSAEVIFDFNYKPIMFLTMVSADEGFVIEYQKTINQNDETTLFFYHHLIKAKDGWHKKFLFSFTIPLNLLLDGGKRIFESILPLLPRIIDHSIYFVNCSENENNYLEPYYYDMATEMTKKLDIADQGHFFVPMKCGKALYGGGSKNLFKPLKCFLT